MQLKHNKDLSDYEQSVLERWLDEAKFTRVLKPSTTNEAVQRVICHYIFDSRMVQLQAIAVSILFLHDSTPVRCWRWRQYEIDW